MELGAWFSEQHASPGEEMPVVRGDTNGDEPPRH